MQTNTKALWVECNKVRWRLKTCPCFLVGNPLPSWTKSGVQTLHWRRGWDNNPFGEMEATGIQLMDIPGTKSELSERWRVWSRGFTYFAEGKAKLQNAGRKKSELLYRAGSGVQDIFENLAIIPAPEGEDDDVYQETVRTLNAYFQRQENAAYERHVLR